MFEYNEVKIVFVNPFQYFLRSCGNNVEFHIDPMPQIHCDAAQMIQVFQNLISNGIKYRKNVPPKIWVKVKPNIENWVFSIEDNGIGINNKYYNKIISKLLLNIENRYCWRKYYNIYLINIQLFIFLQKVMNPVCITPKVFGLVKSLTCHSLLIFSTVFI